MAGQTQWTGVVNCQEFGKAVNHRLIFASTDFSPVKQSIEGLHFIRGLLNIVRATLCSYVAGILDTIFPDNLPNFNKNKFSSELSKLFINIHKVRTVDQVDLPEASRISDRIGPLFSELVTQSATKVCENTDFRAISKQTNITRVFEAAGIIIPPRAPFEFSQDLLPFVLPVGVVILIVCLLWLLCRRSNKVPGAKCLVFLDHIKDSSNFPQLNMRFNQWMTWTGLGAEVLRVNRATPDADIDNLPLLLPIFVSSRVGEDIKRPKEQVDARVPPGRGGSKVLVLFYNRPRHKRDYPPTQLVEPGWSILDVCYDTDGLYGCDINNHTTQLMKDILTQSM